MRGCSAYCVRGGLSLEQEEFETSLGHQLNGDTKLGYMRVQERAGRKRKARKLRGKAAESGPKAREESVLNRSAQPLQENQNLIWNIVDAGG